MTETNSTELTTVDEAELAALAGELGADSASGDYLPNFKTQYDDEVEVNGKTVSVKPGQFTITGMDIPVFASVARIRVLSQHFQYRAWDKKTETVTNKTVFINSFNDEARDERGTLRCGKPQGKVLKQMTEAEQKQFEDISAYRVLHVLVSFDGKDALDNPVSVKDMLCVWNGKGSNFTPFEDEYRKKMPKTARIWDYELTVSNQKQKNGTTTYYVTHFEPDFSTRLPITTEVFEQMKSIKERIDSQNEEIEEKHFLALEKVKENLEAKEIVAKVLDASDNLQDDFQDIL